jgi:hypothetical protein
MSSTEITAETAVLRALIRISKIFNHPIHGDRQLQIILISLGPNSGPKSADFSTADVAAVAEETEKTADENPAGLAPEF